MPVPIAAVALLDQAAQEADARAVDMPMTHAELDEVTSGRIRLETLSQREAVMMADSVLAAERVVCLVNEVERSRT